MRIASIGLAIGLAPPFVSVEPAVAAERPWCLQGGQGAPGGDLPDCAYYTEAQCRASIGGGGDGCFPNPALAWDRLQGKRQPPTRQKRER